MMTNRPLLPGFDRAVFDALPALLFVVDGEIRLIEANRAAQDAAGQLPELNGGKVGDILRCVHCEGHADGCGHAPACGACVIKNSVRQTYAGRRTAGSFAKIKVRDEGEAGNVYLLVTAAPIALGGARYALLTLENITELIGLKGLIPICSFCKMIRDDQGNWNRVESYIESRSEARFSHSVCPGCIDKHYPGLDRD